MECRLIHELLIDGTALAVVVFDGQKEDLVETLGHSDRDLARTSCKEFAKLLVAGRVDAGGRRCSTSRRHNMQSIGGGNRSLSCW